MYTPTLASLATFFLLATPLVTAFPIYYEASLDRRYVLTPAMITSGAGTSPTTQERHAQILERDFQHLAMAKARGRRSPYPLTEEPEDVDDALLKRVVG